ALIPGSLLGYAHTSRITQTWIEKMILPFTVQGEVTTEHHNQSLVGLLYRLGTESPSFYDEDEQPVAYHNVASLAPETVRLLVKGLGVAFLLLLFWSSRSPMAPRERTRLTAEFALVLLGMLLFSERTWKHHCVTLLLPVGLLCYIATAWPVSRRTRHLIFAVLGAATLIMATTSTSLTAGLGLGKEAAKLAQVYGAYVWAELLLLGTIAVLIHGVLARSEAAAPDHAGKPRLGQAA
ncbi:MAG TPA: hypothetical protein PKC45_12695, partial [Gemmatales bacterium]|nr:hypothetical protein [Gemmatales bacterium]